MSDGPRRVVVTAATGFTGPLIARELIAAGRPFVLTGRSAEKLRLLRQRLEGGAGAGARAPGGIETAVLDVRDPAALERLLRKGDVLLNCAGPYTALGLPVVAAAVRAGADYLDITGEQHFIREVYDRFDSPARAAGVRVVPAMAFDYAPGDCAAALAAEGLSRPLRTVDVVYSVAAGPRSFSRGTRLSMVQVLAQPSWAYEAGEWRQQRVALRHRTVRLGSRGSVSAVSFAAGEVLMVPRREAVRSVRTWMVVGRRGGALASLASPALSLLVRVTRPLAERAVVLGGAGPGVAQRQATAFTIIAEAEGNAGERRRVELMGRDVYGLTAIVAVHGALRLLDTDPDEVPAGALTPAQLERPAVLLDGLGRLGLSWSRGAIEGL